MAVEAVRVTFRAGLVIATTGSELEHPRASNESWSVSVSRDSGLADGNNLEGTCRQMVRASGGKAIYEYAEIVIEHSTT